MTVPRRLPRTQGERIRNVDRSHASMSGQGMTASARPVVQSRPNPQIYQPPSGAAIKDRLFVYTSFNTADLTGANAAVSSWQFTFASDGTSVRLNDPDDGGIYLYAPGVYAVTMMLTANGIQAANPAMSVVGLIDSGELTSTPAVQMRGGDGAPGVTTALATSTTQWCPGRGRGGGIYPSLAYQNLDPAVSSIGIEIDVQRIT